MRRLGGLVCVIAAATAACTDSASSGPKAPACEAGGQTGPAGVSLTKLRTARIDKLDLLFVVDNSISMADKQSELARRIPELIAAIADPTPLLEVMKEGTDAGRPCEAIAKGLCTPGAAPCRREGSAYPPITPALAAAQLNLPINVVGADGVARPTMTQAIAEGGNVYVIGRDAGAPRKHLVCELQQLAGAELQTCINDPSFTIDPTTGGGFCYSTRPEVIGEQCMRVGATGTIRYLGGVEPRVGSETFTYCFDPNAAPAPPGDGGC
ncbi:MAG: hypothetical protein HYV09_32585 [Deltaproteobacteria bacterium]|nr:hypothetical protein [Deltaproteobacteria bacterium]